MPSYKTKARFFSGDDASLVDELVKACERPTTADITGGRDLVPCDSAWFDSPFDQATRSAPRAPAAKAKHSRKLSAPSSPSASSSPVRTHKASKTSTVVGPVTPTLALVNKQSKAPATTDKRGASPVSRSSAAGACPAMFTSPKPEAIPMPTSSLLGRALLSATKSAALSYNAACVAPHYLPHKQFEFSFAHVAVPLAAA